MRPQGIAMLLALVLPLASPAPVLGAAAVQPLPVSARLATLSDAELAARLDFLQARLAAQRPTGLAWQWGWVGLSLTGTAHHAAEAAQADSKDARVRRLVEAVLSAGKAVFLLVEPLPARLGAEPMLAVPAEDRAGRLQRLAAGESQLLVSGQHAETRYSLWRHLRSIAVSLLGSGLIVTFGDRSDAFHTLLTNIALDEAQIWSEPWQPATDLRDYRTQFAAPVGVSWEVQATGTGLALVLRF